MITFEEYENALKQRHGERIHNILSHSSVAIAGLGGLGSNIAMYLARAGVGHLHLVDFDKVDITNLNRQQYDIADLGTLKTDALTKNIKRFNPFIEITSQCVKVNEDNAAEIFGGYKIVCEAFDKAENKAIHLNLFDIDLADESMVHDGITFNKKDILHNLTLFLYPDESDEDGRKLRVYQQYFMVSNAAQLILDEAVSKGSNLHDLADYAVVQINDTHPSMIIPEFIRLLGERGIDFDEAAEIVSHVPIIQFWLRHLKNGQSIIWKTLFHSWFRSSASWMKK